MLLLRSNESLRLKLDSVPASELPWYATFRDLEVPAGITSIPGVSVGLSDGVNSVVLIDSASVGSARLISDVNVHNSNVSGVQINLEIWNGTTAQAIGSWFLNPSERLSRGDRLDWTLFDSAGLPKTVGAGLSLRGDVTEGDLLTSGQGGLASSGFSTDAGSFDGVPWRRLAVSGSNLSLILTPGAAGTSNGGALTAQVPDGTAIGGNQRGVNAVDWQTVRTSATQVASGDRSTVSGGYRNTASGSRSTVAGGDSNTASSSSATVSGGYLNTAAGSFQSTVAGGRSNTASGNRATVSGGQDNTASNTYTTVAGGHVNTASGTRSTVFGGRDNTASASYSSIPGGRRGLSDHGGELALSHHGLGTTTTGIGVLQQSLLTWSRSTSNAIPTELSLNGSSTPTGTALPSLTRLIINDNTAYAFLIRLMGRDGSDNIKWWEFRGCVKRRTGPATTAFVGPLTVLTGSDSGTAAGWNASLQASTSVGGLLPFVSGSGTTIRWCASGHLTKITAF